MAETASIVWSVQARPRMRLGQRCRLQFHHLSTFTYEEKVFTAECGEDTFLFPCYYIPWRFSTDADCLYFICTAFPFTAHMDDLQIYVPLDLLTGTSAALPRRH